MPRSSPAARLSVAGGEVRILGVGHTAALRPDDQGLGRVPAVAPAAGGGEIQGAVVGADRGGDEGVAGVAGVEREVPVAALRHALADQQRRCPLRSLVVLGRVVVAVGRQGPRSDAVRVISGCPGPETQIAVSTATTLSRHPRIVMRTDGSEQHGAVGRGPQHSSTPARSARPGRLDQATPAEQLSRPMYRDPGETPHSLAGFSLCPSRDPAGQRIRLLDPPGAAGTGEAAGDAVTPDGGADDLVGEAHVGDEGAGGSGAAFGPGPTPTGSRIPEGPGQRTDRPPDVEMPIVQPVEAAGVCTARTREGCSDVAVFSP